MATPREIRRRIRSVRNTAQITRAMEMVAAARMRRAQERVRSARPYATQIRAMIAALSDLGAAVDVSQFPLLQHRPVKKAQLILVTADRGLAGALNSNVIRRALRFIHEDAGVPVEMVAIGRKGRDFFARVGQNMTAEFTHLGPAPTMDQIRPAITLAINDFIEGRVDAVYVVYTRFINTLQQQPEVLQILPIEAPSDLAESERVRDFIFEPSPEAVLQALLPRYVEIQLYQALLESIASEESARMVAMRNATDNARELIDDLTLTLNKARQAQITREVSEIAAGAAALGG
ncbi:MAG: ATP synthase F1 subunit gamma [Chloroflexi bacterium]|nr:MAG: ATP synthase F1 subunit gamma [Chloroflexota bacterium]